jgi:hypothetical protein
MRVVEVGARFTRGGRYRDSMTIDGRNRIVRQADGVHLNRPGRGWQLTSRWTP